MPHPPSDYPTGLELQILKILWRDAPLSVREVRARLAEEEGRKIAHTSVITTLNIMVGKKYLRRSKQKNAYLFRSRVTREEVSEGMLSDLVGRVFDGSAASLMLSLFNCSEVDEDELKELRSLIRRKAKEQSQ